MNFEILMLRDCIANALKEDIGTGDITTECTIDKKSVINGKFIAKASGIVAGLVVAAEVYRQLDEGVRITAHISDGEAVNTGDLIAEIYGPARAILTGERTALNFLQRMSGIATLTRQFTEAVRDTDAIILDTRKTAPGLRLIDKWAVKTGGGENHRIGLYDMVMIKDNHIEAAGGITAAVERVRYGDRENRAIEVEVKNLDELQEALALKVDRIMLDNMDTDTMRKAVEMSGGRVKLEASGNVDLGSVKQIARTGVNYISIGKLTHSAPALDISLMLSKI